ncbi:MAG: efflux RND transporter periplasmic adaptor subunit [Paludibacter sp.]
MRKNFSVNLYQLGLLLLFMNFLWACNHEQVKEVPVGKVIKGTFRLEIFEEGEIEAIRSTNVTAPAISWRYGIMKITQIVKDGKEVKAGDTLAVFDPSEIRKAVSEAEARLGMSKAELEKLGAQQQSDLEELKADYEITRISQEISRIRFESAGYEADIKKKEIKLNLEKANIALDRAKEQIDNKIKIQKEEIKQKNLSINQDVARLQEANETLKKLFLVSPSPGIAIINRNWSSGNKLQIGDQCWPGYPLILLPDLSSLKAIVKINEVDIAKIHKGLKVEIKPDAFSNSVYDGEVTSVANLAVNKDDKSKVKVFPVEILLKKTDKKLLPGLTVSCRIILGTIKNALFIPIDALHSEGAVNYVFKKTANGYEKTIVSIGVSNSDYIVITKGLEATDKVTLEDPTKEDKDTKSSTDKQVQTK